MSELARVVNLFRRLGARCRKLRGRDVYVCFKEDVKAEITPRGIILRVLGDFRSEYLDLAPEGYSYEEYFLKSVESAAGAEHAYLDVRGDLYLVLRYRLEDAARAAKIFKKLADHDMYVAATNMVGELRLYKDGERASPEEWLDFLEW